MLKDFVIVDGSAKRDGGAGEVGFEFDSAMERFGDFG